MRYFLLFGLVFTVSASNAGTLEKCQASEQDKAAIKSCVDAEHSKTGNVLRELNLAAAKAATEKTKDAGRKVPLRHYRSTEAHYARNRAATCNKRPEGMERQACETDMNSVHIEELKRFIAE